MINKFCTRRYCAPWIAVHVGTLLFCANPHAVLLNGIEVKKKKRKRERERVRERDADIHVYKYSRE